ncbi:histidine kinase|uniref:sensor histidine kinase n=1 Tax=Noviherbaspirillum sp. L7-7A TaxID=2850560 RepID=UPI001C2BD909|nr:histidine kinase [Noviherbaspirillum sp. L7-7A]MBV0881087.1 histidine kinase [Noviherbaspirillum sp. L7-7A]
MVTHIRLLLAVSALLTIFTESAPEPDHLDWAVFIGYTLHTTALFVLSLLHKPIARSKLIHWLDACWYTMMVVSTGGSQSLFFLFFFFAILTASFRWGFEEGARVTVASTLLFFAACGLEKTVDVPSILLLRATFLLALGYMISRWGQSELTSRRRLALLRDVSRLSNPRFGVDHTVTSVMRKTLEFFSADSCVLVVRTEDKVECQYRAVKGDTPAEITRAQQVDAQAMAPLLNFARDQAVVYCSPTSPRAAFLADWRVYDSASNQWIKGAGDEGHSVAEMLNSRTFIAAPVPLRHGEGRIYALSGKRDFRKADALFLGHIAAQAFPVIENIELLDRIASEAASQERKKIAYDLHDAVIQPYIGLKIALHAMSRKAKPDNPLAEDLQKISDMAAQVIQDLRRYAGGFSDTVVLGESVFLASLHRQAEQVRKFYGIDITVSVDDEIAISDRLAAEVYHVVSEGLANIRKHTSARRGAIWVSCAEGWLKIRIENEGDETHPADFTPRSISHRAAALGGRARVLTANGGRTAVHIEIPV